MNARSVAVKVLSEIERDGSYSNIASDAAIRPAVAGTNAMLPGAFLFVSVSCTTAFIGDSSEYTTGR